MKPFSYPGKVFRLILGAGILIWTYVLLRVLMVPLMHDEAATFFHYVLPERIWPGIAHWDANNHILNSWLVTGTTQLLGNTVFALRLPGLLFFIIYLYATFQLSRYAASWKHGCMMLAGLWGAHFILEFFGYSRGYGISLALLALAIWLTFQTARRFNLIAASFSLVLLLLACSANLTLLPTTLLVCSWLLFFTICKKPRRIRDVLFIAPLTGFVFAMLYLIDFGQSLDEKGLLYYGGDHFIGNSVASLYIYSTGLGGEWVFYLLAALGGLLIAFGAVRARQRGTLKDPFVLASLLLAGAVGAVLLLHEIKGTRYPLDRTGIHLLFLFLFAAGLFPYRAKRLPYSMTLIGPLFLLGGINQLSLHQASVWHTEHMTNAFYEAFRQAEKGNPHTPIMSGYHLRRLTWAWMVREGDVKSSIIHFNTYPDPHADYILGDPGSLANPVIKDNFEILIQDPYSENTLFKRVKPLERVALRDTLIHDLIGNHEFFNIFNLSCAEFAGKTVALTFEGTGIIPPHSQMEMAASTIDTTGQLIQYNSMPFKWLFTYSRSPQTFKNVLYMGTLPSHIGTIKLYLWNVAGEYVEMELMRAEVIELSE